MKAIVTGGAGFIGSHITDKLIKTGCQVTVIDNLSTGDGSYINPNADFICEDIRSDRLSGIFKMQKPEVVFHQAAQTDVGVSLRQPLLDAGVNILGTLNVLEACVRAGVRKIIYASSAAAFGDPLYLGIDENHPIEPVSQYGVSKHTPEHYFRVYEHLYGLKFTALRYANVYGVRQDPKGEGGVVSIFTDKLLTGQQPVIFGEGRQTRDFIYVADVVEANIAAIDRADNVIINIGTGIETSILELFETMKKIAGVDMEAVYAPPREGDILNSCFDIGRAVRLLCWNPRYILEDGLRQTIIYYAGLYKAPNEVAAAVTESVLK